MKKDDDNAKEENPIWAKTGAIDGVLGAIAGDIIGSVYEWNRIKTEEFPLFSPDVFFTDDTVLTIAAADALLTDDDYGRAYRQWGREWPDADYGGRFRQWLMEDDPKPYESFGNGSAMRASPAAYAADSLEEVLRIAKETAMPTHNHPQGVIGAQAVAGATFIARKAAPDGDEASCKGEIKDLLQKHCGYDMQRTVAEIRPSYAFDETCQGSVPEALTCFLEAACFEDAVRKAVSLGVDADTQACIAGAPAGALWGVPEHIRQRSLGLLDAKMLRVLEAFAERFGR